MSVTSGGPGWWLASDGRWYPPETHPDYRRQMDEFAQPPPGPPQGPPLNPVEMSAPGPIPPAFTFANNAPEPAAPAVAAPPVTPLTFDSGVRPQEPPSATAPPTPPSAHGADPAGTPTNAADSGVATALADGAATALANGAAANGSTEGAANVADVVQRFLRDASAQGLLSPLHGRQDEESLRAAADAADAARSASEAAQAAAASAGNVADAVHRFTVVRTSEAEIGELLIRCQQFIESIVADAERQAHEIVAAARSEAGVILADAGRRAGEVPGPAPRAAGPPGLSSQSADDLNSTIDGYIRVNNELMHELRLLSGSFGPGGGGQPPQAAQAPPPAPAPTYPRP
jgi:hypothetical protein